MTKSKLSKGQQRRVQTNHQRRLTQTDKRKELDDSLHGEPQDGIVISR
ncbi:ribosome biogenesis GTPase RsgA, partial [Salmonella enterica subsp. enterica]|nr:ribosome biogenesis GTPase RsgA [Salmonella enterica]